MCMCVLKEAADHNGEKRGHGLLASCMG
jgi:hypothetical protein